MKIPRGEFLRMFSGNAAAAIMLPKALAVAPGNIESHEALKVEIKGKDNSNQFQWFDVVPDILYSRFEAVDFAERMTVGLFVRSIMDYPRGLADTNIYRAGTLNAPEMHAVGAIQIIADRVATEQQLGEFERNVTGTLWIDCKSYAYPHMSRVLTSASLDDLITRDESIFAKPGKLMSSKAHRMNPPIIILANQSFHFDLQVSQGWRIGNSYKPTFGGYVLLDGHRARAIQ